MLTYESPAIRLSSLEDEGIFCASEVQEVETAVEVDDWVTVESEVTFE